MYPNTPSTPHSQQIAQLPASPRNHGLAIAGMALSLIALFAALPFLWEEYLVFLIRSSPDIRFLQLTMLLDHMPIRGASGYTDYIASILAIIFGSIGVAQTRSSRHPGRYTTESRSVARFGLILGIITLLAPILVDIIVNLLTPLHLR